MGTRMLLRKYVYAKRLHIIEIRLTNNYF